MLRKSVLLLVLCTCVSVAFGAAVKITDFVIIVEPEGADATAILNYQQGHNKTVVQLIISGFTPGKTYDVVFDSGSHSGPATAAIVTDGSGHGTLHTDLVAVSGNGDWSDSHITIGFNLRDADTGNDRVRAFGTNPAYDDD